ncbi:MAG: class I SAM-dependent methyltransferase [Mycobacterium sp.]
MTEAMAAEFDTVAEWTAQVAAKLGSAYHIPAGCRGSGTPAALEWLIDNLGLAPGQAFLDCGAGVGGPAAYAVQQRAVRPLLVEPEAGACRAARDLFGYPVLRAVASALPIADGSFDAAWSLGVLCTMRDQLSLLTEMRRVVRRTGHIGVLAFVARELKPDERPEGNNFPTAEFLRKLVERAGLRIEAWHSIAELPPAPPDWAHRVDTVESELRLRHSEKSAWQMAEQQAEMIGRLLDKSAVTGELLILRRP